MSEEKFRGASVRTLPRPNKSYGQGRVCADPVCETKLSVYNKWNYCWQHNRSTRTSRVASASAARRRNVQPTTKAEALREAEGLVAFKETRTPSDDGEDRSPRARETYGQ